jgi:hypothetical protein
MTRSTHRYSLWERNPMAETYRLGELIERFTRYQVAAGRAQGTIDRYGYTFLLFHRYLAAEGLPQDSSVLTTQGIEGFALYLRTTPISPQHGSTTAGLIFSEEVRAAFRSLR